MTQYRVTSDRLSHPRGTLVSAEMLEAGGNIPVLVAAGHLVPVEQLTTAKTLKTKPPVMPEPEPAELPEEQD